MTSYIAPAILNPGVTGTASLQQPQTASPAAMSSRTAYIVSALVGLGVFLGAAGLACCRYNEPVMREWRFSWGGKARNRRKTGQSLLSEVMIGMSRLSRDRSPGCSRPSKVQKLSTTAHLWQAIHSAGVSVSSSPLSSSLAALGLAAGVLLICTSRRYPVRGVLVMIIDRIPRLSIADVLAQTPRQAATERDPPIFPDALDLLTICVEAGLGMDGAILEVVNRWDNALSDEFSIVLAELKMGRGRRDALRSLADRTGLQEVTSFTSALIQADELGMGIARPLALQAQQLRIKRKQRAEKLAHEAGIKMVVAMGIFIMPAMFMIILSPAVVQIHGNVRRALMHAVHLHRPSLELPTGGPMSLTTSESMSRAASEMAREGRRPGRSAGYWPILIARYVTARSRLGIHCRLDSTHSIASWRAGSRPAN